MVYEEGTIRTALVLLRELLQSPVVNRENNPGLTLQLQQDPEVLNLWKEILEPVFGIYLLKAGDEYYLTTGIAESIFNYSNEELRKSLGIENNTELYTCFFIVLSLIAALYNSDDTTRPSREFINLTDLERLVTHNFQVLTGRNDLEELENNTRTNLAEPGRLWLDLAVQNPQAERPRMTHTRWGLLLKTLDFLEKHQLVRVIGERQVFPQPRLHSLVAYYYNHREHKNLILELISSQAAGEVSGNAPAQPDTPA